MSIQQFVNYHKQDPFAKNEFLGYVTMLQNIREFRTNWMKDHLNVDIKEFQEYEDMFKAFRSNLKSNSTGDLVKFIDFSVKFEVFSSSGLRLCARRRNSRQFKLIEWNKRKYIEKQENTLF